MATNVYTFADAEINTRWKEPFLTRGFNAAHAGVRPHGIYRGFVLAGTGSNWELSIEPDAVAGDHLAVYLTSSGCALTLRRTGALVVDLAPYAGDTVYVTLRASYVLGAQTTAYVRIYTAAEYAVASERAELLVLGVIPVPISDPLTEFSLGARTLPSRTAARGAVAPVSLLRNPGFEAGIAGDAGIYSAYFWEKQITVGTASWRVSSSVHATGSLKSLALNVSAGPVTGTVYQPITCPVRPGYTLRLAYRLRVDDPTTAGSITLAVSFLNAAGATAATQTFTLATGASTSSAFVAYEEGFAVPAGVTHVRGVALTATAAAFAVGGAVLFLDDVSLQLLESEADFEDAPDAHMAAIQAAAALLLEDSGASAYSAASLLRHKSSAVGGDPGLELSGRDGSPNLLNLLGRLFLGRGLTASPLTPRLKADVDPGNLYTLVVESDGGTGGAVRVYVSADGLLLLTTNSFWTGSLWSRDITVGVGSTAVLLSQGELTFYDHASSLGDTWSDTFADPAHWRSTASFPVVVSGSPATVATPFTAAGAIRSLTTLQSDSTLYAARSLANSDAGADTPHIVADRCLTPSRSLILEMTSAAAVGARLYRSYSGSSEFVELVVNAVWDSAGAIWTRETGSTFAVKLSLGPDGLSLYRANSASFADGAWGTTALRVSSTPSPAPTTAPAVNSLHATQVARSWAKVTTDGLGGVTLVEGFNVASVSLLAGALVVTLATPMTDANYAVTPSVVTTVATKWYGANPLGLAYSGFAIAVAEYTGGAVAQVDLAAVALTITFNAFGHQS